LDAFSYVLLYRRFGLGSVRAIVHGRGNRYTVHTLLPHIGGTVILTQDKTRL
jgi:hypothetical protein